ncbi:MAG: LysM peptidoglycan-binding domain-containing protein [Chloroflexi bacterium]|nr:LysM peptidoglycan-binding domain-containing protein [Chloroflexota bacterium]
MMDWTRKLPAPTATLIVAALASSLVAGCSAVSAQPTPTLAPPPTAAAAPAPPPTRPPLATPVPQAKPTAKPTVASADEAYVVQEGDTLGKIAQRFYSDSGQWRRIYDANKDVLGDNPDAIRIGAKLRIPPKSQT